MLTTILKWSAMGVLMGRFFVGPLPGYTTFLQFVVSAAAGAALVQAAGMQRYLWMGVFLVAACLFNPVFPVDLSHQIFIIVSALTLILFFLSVQLVHSKPRLSIASITDHTPRNQSL